MFRLVSAPVCLLAAVWMARAEPISELIPNPPQVKLDGPEARYTLLISGKTASGRIVDLTRTAKFTLSDSAVALVSPTGEVMAKKDGTATLTVEAEGKSIQVPVTAMNTTKTRGFDFETDISPLLGRFTCNMSGCHGKAEGQNGFKLSVFGFDPSADFNAMVKESRGRRVFPASPHNSLLLTKASGQAPHGGGTKMPVGSEAYRILESWIAAGTPFGDGTAPRVTGLRVEPSERTLTFRDPQQLRVIAKYSDGRDVDVTRLARFQSNREVVASVDADGFVRTDTVPGEAAVMAAFMNEVAIFRVLVPRPGRNVAIKRPAANFIDPLVDTKLAKLNVEASTAADDSEFLRRVYLDVIGTLPTADEARSFLASKDADKRAKLVDALLARPEYADLWTQKWADVLRVDRGVLGHKRAYTYFKWVRKSVADNKPFDAFARELIAAEGPLDEVGPANFYKAVTKPGEVASAISQVFLGLRITCAECHHHPFDRWSQDDYAGMAAFFSPVSVKKIGTAEATVSAGNFTATHPRTKATVPATLLNGKPVEVLPGSDAREKLAEWVTSPENPYFARNLANRVWAQMFGNGIVEPVDDVRSTNPPTNPQLLDALAKFLVDNKYDVKKLIREIALSRTYQTTAHPTESNAKDDRNFSRALFRPVPAEVFCDMLSQSTGVPEKFDGVSAGVRAIQLWDSRAPSYILRIFGRPVRMSACECERVTEPTLTGVLHTLNSEELSNKLRHDAGTAAKWAKDIPDDKKLAEELTLTFYGRPPTAKEIETMTAHLRKHSSDRRRAVEDLMWAVLNTREFQQNH